MNARHRMGFKGILRKVKTHQRIKYLKSSVENY